MHIIKTKVEEREEKYATRRMRLQSLATSDWHFDGNYKNLTLIGPTMISASLLCLFTFPELLFVQKQEKSDLRLLCEKGLMMCKDYKIRQAFY